MTGRLASIIYGPTDDCDALLTLFAETVQAEGAALAGLVQLNVDAPECGDRDMALKDLSSGTIVNICQDLGPGSANACRIDPGSMAEAASLLRLALAKPCDLVIINKFGRLESEGSGLITEIGQAYQADIPIIIGVPARFVTLWEEFCGADDHRLPCDHKALMGWWQSLKTKTQQENAR